MNYRETHSLEETQKLYEEYLIDNGKSDTVESYNDFYNGAENNGYSVQLVVPLDEFLSRKYGFEIPSKVQSWYELRKK